MTQNGPVSAKAAIRRALDETRRRTLDLVSALPEDELVTQHDPRQSPVVWDLGHIANFEELWLVQELAGTPPLQADLNDVYNAAHHPRPTRSGLQLMSKARVLDYLDEVRGHTLKVLDGTDPDPEDPLLADAFVYYMILQHESQHQETILTTLQMRPAGVYQPPVRREAPGPTETAPSGMVRVPGGPFTMGTDRRAGRYDNEWPAHEVDVPAFEIDAAPVTNRDFLEFVDDGGYEREEVWDEEGWLVKQGLGWEHPLYWQNNGADGWTVRRYDRVVELPLDHPVIHVSWYEADAYARWAGKRLPTEAEWEKAATWDPSTGTKRQVPWSGEWTPRAANLDQTLFGTAPVGSQPDGVTATGCHDMFGQAWEWTSTEFSGYPGFEPFPYPEYSQDHFDAAWYVCRGGCWATRPNVARGTFRNWASQDQRHIFTGFRCARDADGGTE